MFYFAYGSNMCTGRLKRRVPSAVPVGVARLTEHIFRFHKRSTDGSSKGDAFETGVSQDVVWGVIFEINEREKATLDEAEGLGHGYCEKTATLVAVSGTEYLASLYIADANYIDATLRPYSWYKRFVVEGARQHGLPVEYVDTIAAMPDAEDGDTKRDRKNRSIGC